jgi:putative ABC transport system ATP-binding protein
VIDFEAVTKHFGSGANRIEALRGLTLRIPEGQMCALMGPSGAGKSTLMHAATGLTSIDSGSITVAGQRISNLDSEASALMRRERVGVILQAINLVPFFTA